MLASHFENEVLIPILDIYYLVFIVFVVWSVEGNI